MATTTNYGWETPDDTDLVKDGALAIRTLGSSIDTTTKNLNPETTLGDISYRSATANTNTRLPIGTTGQILTVSGGVPVWASPAGGGKVLQVVSSVITAQHSQTSETYTDVTNFNASITPSATSSKVLVVFQVSSRISRAGDQVYSYGQIARGNTAIYEGYVHAQNLGGNTQNFDNFSNQVMVYLDSPSTTSSTTYKLQIKRAGGAGTIYVNPISTTYSSITLLEIGA